MQQVVEVYWDGENLPDEFHELPPGLYVLTPVDDLVELSAEEDAAVQLGLDAIQAGQFRPLEEVVRELRGRSAATS